MGVTTCRPWEKYWSSKACRTRDGSSQLDHLGMTIHWIHTKGHHCWWPCTCKLKSCLQDRCKVSPCYEHTKYLYCMPPAQNHANIFIGVTGNDVTRTEIPTPCGQLVVSCLISFYPSTAAGGVPSFKGIMVGNPLTYMPYRDHGFYGTCWGHQLLPKPLWDAYVEHDCAKLKNPSAQTPDECWSVTNAMHRILSGLDPYALDFPTCELAATHCNVLHSTASKSTFGRLMKIMPHVS